MPIAAPAEKARAQSGKSRSSAQSPPPITLPARALATPTGRSLVADRTDRRHADVTISAQARELQQRDVSGGGPSGELSPERLQEVLGRVSSGYYDTPKVQAAVVRRIAQDL